MYKLTYEMIYQHKHEKISNLLKLAQLVEYKPFYYIWFYF